MPSEGVVVSASEAPATKLLYAARNVAALLALVSSRYVASALPPVAVVAPV